MFEKDETSPVGAVLILGSVAACGDMSVSKISDSVVAPNDRLLDFVNSPHMPRNTNDAEFCMPGRKYQETHVIYVERKVSSLSH
jgi:hypothetical protein